MQSQMGLRKEASLWTKLREVMEFQLSYFKSWKMILWKCCTQYVSKLGKLSSGHRTGKGKFSFQTQRKAMPENVQNRTITLLSVQFSTVQFSCSVVSKYLRPHESQHARPPCPSPTPGVTQTHVHRVGDAIQPSHPLSPPSPPAPNPSQHQGLFQWVNASHMLAK